MSSIYRPICLNHDPAIVIERDLSLNDATTYTSRENIPGHEHCDIVIGRYSYPLIEVACLGRQLPGPTGCKGHHSGIQWIDRDWLRLLIEARTPPEASSPTALRLLRGQCWTAERLQSLRLELGEVQ